MVAPTVVDEVFSAKQAYFVNFSKTLISVRVFAKGVIEITPARILPPLCKGRWHALRDGGIGLINS